MHYLARHILISIAVAGLLLASHTLTEFADAAGTRLISHRQTLAQVDLFSCVDGEWWTCPGEGYLVAGSEDNSKRPDISADGRYVVFESEAGYFDDMENLDMVSTDSDIYLHDVALDTTTRVSIGHDGALADGESFKPDISPNGEWVVFESNATNLVEDDTNVRRDIFRYQVSTDEIERVSLRSSGDESDWGSYNPSVANDGSIAFESPDSEMVEGLDDTNSTVDVFIRQAGAGGSLGDVGLVSVKNDGSGTPDRGSSIYAELSGDGSTVSFISNASAADLIGHPDDHNIINLYARSVSSDDPETSLVSADTDGNPSGVSSKNSISQNGRFIAFTSIADDLADGISGVRQRLFVRDMESDDRRKNAVIDQDTSSAVTQFRYPDISADGELVTYQRHREGVQQILLKSSTGAGDPQVVSIANNGQQVTEGLNLNPAVSNQGRVAFESNAVKLRQNYLGQGIDSYQDLILEVVWDTSPCGRGRPLCKGISLRDTSSDSVEPGPSDPTPDVNDGEPLIKVDSSINRAAGVPEMTVTLKRPFNYHEFKDVDFKMPAGLLANTNVKKCSEADAVAASCPDSSRIGRAHTDVELIDNLHDIPPSVSEYYRLTPEGRFRKDGIDGDVFFGTPRAGEAGRLYAVVFDPDLMTDPVVVPMGITVVASENYRLRIRADRIPNQIPNAHIYRYGGSEADGWVRDTVPAVRLGTVYPNIERIKLTIFGDRVRTTNGHAFMRNPTFSGPAAGIPAGQSGIDATLDNYGGSRNRRSLDYPVSGSLGFAPQLSAGLSTTKLGAKPVISTEISQPVEETAIKGLRLSFKGFGLDITKGLAGCSAGDRSRSACPAASKLASVKAYSWALQDPLAGDLFLGEGAKNAFTSLRGLITLNAEGDVTIDAAKGAVGLDINKGMPPFSGSRIVASVDGGLFKNPSKCGSPAEISLDATSFTGQHYVDTERFYFCAGSESAASASLKVRLKPNRARKYTKASFTFTQASKKKAKKLKSLELKLGKGKRALRVSTKALKRATRRSRRARTVGKLVLTSAKKGRSVKAKVRVKRGRILISPSGKQLKRYRRTLKRLSKRGKRSSKTYKRARKELKHVKKVRLYLKKKTKIQLVKGKLRLTGLPTSDAYYRISLVLDGKRFRTLRNPKRAGSVTFSAKAKTSKGTKVTAQVKVKIKKAKSKKKRKKRR